MPLEELHSALVFLGCGTRVEGAQIAPFAGFGVFAAGIKPIFASRKFSNHVWGKNSARR
ncbi:MAG: hypothetical protein HZC17_01550 [Candidatus Omnitrophica bacterium]|nr:hypothetical protein [Candidatus Omnitrophota bacterium]